MPIHETDPTSARLSGVIGTSHLYQDQTFSILNCVYPPFRYQYKFVLVTRVGFYVDSFQTSIGGLRGI